MRKRASKANLPLSKKKLVEIRDEDIILTVPYQPASRSRSWLNVDQVEKEHWEVVDKICEMLFDTTGKWHPRSVDFARNVLEFLNDHEFISWKQYDSIMKMKTAAEYKAMYGRSSQVERLSYKPGVETLHSGGQTITSRNNTLNVSGTFQVITPDSPLGMAFKYAKTDRDFDKLAYRLFGQRRYPDNAEEDGYVYKYDKAGRRYEALPDADDIEDFTDLLLEM